MTMFKLLGTADWDVVGKFLSTHYIKNPNEERRRALAQQRDDLYEGKGDLEMETLINTAFKDKKTQDQRKELASYSKWNNVLARVIREKATVYSAPARRKVAKGDDVYQAFLSDLQLDDAMREVDRKLGLHEDVWVAYRVRATPRGSEPVVDVVSPASFWAIAHPKDRTLLVGIILDQRISPDQHASMPAYRVWLDDETFVLDGNCTFMLETYEAWPLGQMPGVLATTRKPTSKQRLLAECPSADLVAAQLAVWLQNLMLLKESKSANMQAYVSGDVSATAMGQAADSENEIFLGEGVSIQVVDRGMDLAQFRDNSEFIAMSAGANHGVPASIMKQEGATSGAEVHLRRIPLRELRQERIPIMRRIETALAKIMSLVNSRRMMTLADESGGSVQIDVPGDLQAFEFSADGFSIDFGEIQQPLTESEADAVYAERKRLNLTDPATEEMVRNPDHQSLDDAWVELEARAGRNLRAYELTQPIAAANGSAFSQVGDKTAAENGADGQAAAKANDAKSDDGGKMIPFAKKP